MFDILKGLGKNDKVQLFLCGIFVGLALPLFVPIVVKFMALTGIAVGIIFALTQAMTREDKDAVFVKVNGLWSMVVDRVIDDFVKVSDLTWFDTDDTDRSDTAE